MNRFRTLRLILWSLVVVAAIATGIAVWALRARPLPGPQIASSLADIGGPFRLMTHKGQPFGDADLRGRPHLLFFGFTHCPDVCPTTLSELTQRYEALGKDADKLTTLLVTVDPERDTPELLKEYMAAFDPRFIALRGTNAETEAIASAYKAYVKKVPLEGGGYTMDHTTIVYMLDRKGRFAGALDRHEDEEVQLAKLRSLISE